jgi:hypothetical protein
MEDEKIVCRGKNERISGCEHSIIFVVYGCFVISVVQSTQAMKYLENGTQKDFHLSSYPTIAVL